MHTAPDPRPGRTIKLLLLLTISGCYAFKEHDFKTCATNGFCNRNRGKADTKFTVLPGSVSVSGAHLSATLVNGGYQDAQLRLTATALSGGVVHLLIDEPKEGRYRVQDVLMPGVLSNTVPWKSQSVRSGWAVSAENAVLSLEASPFKLSVAVNGVPVMVVNERNMFNFETRRTKQEGDPEDWWEESFGSHRDSKPKGPEAMSLDVVFPGSEHIYGIPEHATNLALGATAGVSEPYRMYNLDVFEYVDHSPFGLYGSIPFLLSHKQGATCGLLWLNGAEMYVDVSKHGGGQSVQWLAESGVMELFLLLGPSPQRVTEQYAVLTGPSAMPQMFSIGYHQCRWNYKDEADVFSVDSHFDLHEIPYDVLWLDIEHTNGKRYLTWDAGHFPKPAEMQHDLASRGRKMVTIVDPHVKRDHNYYIHKEAEEKKFYVKNRDGDDFDGWCWPGQSSYLDVTSPDVRAWWAQQFTLDKYVGSTEHLYIWNDMNEPSVFNGPEITMPKDNIHYGDTEHRDVHNVYGLYYHMATADGLVVRGETLNPDGDRPFVLSRAFYAGTQRVGPIWTGDNAASWSHLKVSVPMLLTLGLTGLPNSGADVGGFFGNPTVELLTRWYQVGIYYPFFRGHAHIETQRREPWLFGPDATRRVKEAIQERYALLPYLYTLFRAANVTGAPIVRPLWFEFPNNKDTFAIEEEFLLGSALLVRPVVSEGVTAVETFLPRAAKWYDTRTGAEASVRGQRHSGAGRDQQYTVKVDKESIPSFYRGGHIIPRRERPRRSTATQVNDPVTLVVALDSGLEASGTLYMDDGHSFSFVRGQYFHRAFTFSKMRLTSSEHHDPSVARGTWAPGHLAVERIVFLGLPASPTGWAVKATDGGPEVLLEAGPLSQAHAPTALHTHVLRLPNLALVADWVLDVVPATARA